MTWYDLQKMMFCLAAGLGIGCFHFGGLWFTLLRFAGTKHYGLVFVVSFLFRSFVTLAGVYFAANGEWHGMTVCLGGILIMRKVFVVKMQPSAVFRAKGSPI
ncbi:MAG: ATP synthase subunit I [Desulfotignum sp.]|nr:ATP synthase subunit I [Desulfotignum sp.]